MLYYYTIIYLLLKLIIFSLHFIVIIKIAEISLRIQ